ncbi:hypothetical protein [Azospirillum argentinense]
MKRNVIRLAPDLTRRSVRRSLISFFFESFCVSKDTQISARALPLWRQIKWLRCSPRIRIKAAVNQQITRGLPRHRRYPLHPEWIPLDECEEIKESG